MQVYKRIALIGAIANPNIGDEAILEANLQKIKKMYGDNCKVYVFTKDSSYTAMYNSLTTSIVPVDYLHRITKACQYNIENLEKELSQILKFSDSDGPDNFLYKILHDIFKEIDILHIIGGGYLNSLWPDMLYEILIATQLAQKYEKKSILTGISIYPLKKEHHHIFQRICNAAEFIDFRDDSYTELSFIHKNDLKYTKTLDDAIYLESNYPKPFDSNYACVLFHSWKNCLELIIDKITCEIIPFLENIIQAKIVNNFYILGFSKGDLDIWEKVNIPNSIKNHVYFKDLTYTNCIEAKYILSNAKFNIGSRFHLAVFSLSSKVPVLSVYYDNYYLNKLKSIHKLFNSTTIISLDDITEEKLEKFCSSTTEKQKELSIGENIARKKELKKNELICKTYAINQNDETLLLKKLNKNFSQPTISVIIPIYNMHAYLRECLDSVIKQSLHDIEIICINDGSTDYSQMILNEYAWKDKRIRVISQENQGVAYARNVGIETACGEFLYFLDPDDWLPDSEVFYDLYHAAKSQRVLICGGNFREYAARGIIDQWDGNLSKYNFTQNEKINYSDYQFDYGWVRFIYNREFILYNHLRIPDLTFFEDPVFFVQAMHKAKEFFAINRCTYCYRTGHKSSELSYKKVLDLMTGLYINIKFAKENNYLDLMALELERIENDYSEIIVRHLLGRDSDNLRHIFSELNRLIYNDNSKIEYRIYNKIIQNKAAIIWEKDNYISYIKEQNNRKIDVLERELSETRHIFYNSTTWKLGNFLLFIPKKIKNFLKGGNT